MLTKEHPDANKDQATHSGYQVVDSPDDSYPESFRLAHNLRDRLRMESLFAESRCACVKGPSRRIPNLGLLLISRGTYWDTATNLQHNASSNIARTVRPIE
jgi:hypothetical protein